MARRYEFYSALTPEQLRARLLVRARPMKSGWAYEEHQVFAKLLPDGRFYVIKTGGMWQVRPLLPFVGQIVPAEGGCYVSGGFLPPKGMKNALLGVMLAVFCMILAVSGGDPFAVAAACVMVPLWGGGGWLLWTRFAPLFAHREQEETLKFVEENLLRE
ncbi:hypothetical protein [Oscillibacter sp.]|uniref:hypothetical protein n=1 Tax=Oscillibacter sp. TaxID=1945593 RepID=UPI002625E897|nr:hypothetical protein [Oscillibacter sp.]MDD3346489.1 hypothetical protein [Oscillibacter sp.]